MRRSLEGGDRRFVGRDFINVVHISPASESEVNSTPDENAQKFVSVKRNPQVAAFRWQQNANNARTQMVLDIA